VDLVGITANTPAARMHMHWRANFGGAGSW
jgi:hypothetical protein